MLETLSRNKYSSSYRLWGQHKKTAGLEGAFMQHTEWVSIALSLRRDRTRDSHLEYVTAGPLHRHTTHRPITIRLKATSLHLRLGVTPMFEIIGFLMLKIHRKRSNRFYTNCNNTRSEIPCFSRGEYEDGSLQGFSVDVSEVRTTPTIRKMAYSYFKQLKQTTFGERLIHGYMTPSQPTPQQGICKFTQLIKKLFAIYETRGFFTVFTKSHYQFPS